MSYTSARLLASVVGLGIIGVIVGFMFVRRAEPVEIIAVLLFLAVFFGLLLWDIIGGAIAGVLATGVYVAMRWSAIAQVGFADFSGLVLSHAFGFIAFGVIGGWAEKQLRGSLDKLDLYDQIDDATGLYNARFLLQETDLEQARSKRYDSIFAVSVVDIPTSWFAGLSRRHENKALRGLGRVLRASVRTVDRAGHVATADLHRLVVVLPETGADGAEVFTTRLAEQLKIWLSAQGVQGDGEIAMQNVVLPGNETQLATLRVTLEEIDKLQHPTVA